MKSLNNIYIRPTFTCSPYLHSLRPHWFFKLLYIKAACYLQIVLIYQLRQYIFLYFKFNSSLFFWICFLHVSFLSRWNPRYLLPLFQGVRYYQYAMLEYFITLSWMLYWLTCLVEPQNGCFGFQSPSIMNQCPKDLNIQRTYWYLFYGMVGNTQQYITMCLNNFPRKFCLKISPKGGYPKEKTQGILERGGEKRIMHKINEYIKN